MDASDDMSLEPELASLEPRALVCNEGGGKRRPRDLF